MMHWNPEKPERPDRPLPMERWVFVCMVAQAGMSLGAAIVALIDGFPFHAILFAIIAVVAGGYVKFRFDEAGWP